MHVLTDEKQTLLIQAEWEKASACKSTYIVMGDNNLDR